MTKFGEILESWRSRVERASRKTAEIKQGLKNKTVSDYGEDDFIHLNRYTGNGSTPLNRRLVGFGGDEKELTDSMREMHNAIKRHAEPIGIHLRLYSGSEHNFGEMARKSPDHILHSPAHISASHSHQVARGFATSNIDVFNNKLSDAHMMVIDMKPHNKGLPLGHTINPMEHETVIPAGTKLKYHGTKTVTQHVRLRDTTFGDAPYGAFTDRVGDDYNSKVNMHYHHFTIHSQE